MADEEIIDLTGASPPPSPRSMRLRPRRTRPRRGFICLDCALHLIANNTNNSFNNIYGSPFRTAAGINYYLPMNELTVASPYPLGSSFNGASIPEHDLFMVGMMRYWGRRLSKTARNMMWANMTPQTPPQVDQSYCKSVNGNQPWTYSYNATADGNVMAESNMFTINSVMPISPPPTETLPLFPVQAPLFSEEVNDGNNNNNNGLQIMQTDDANDVSSMTETDGEGELDLELNLGWSK